MARSLLDGADLTALRALAADGPDTAVAAAVVDSGLLQFDPDDPGWEDRDRLVVCGTAVSESLGARLRNAGAQPDRVLTAVDGGGVALGLAFGAAMASTLDGGAWRSWCVLDAAACEDGRVWEVADAVRGAGAQTLGAVVVGDRTAALWGACGWKVHTADAADPLQMLGGLDQLMAAGPAVLLVVHQ